MCNPFTRLSHALRQPRAAGAGVRKRRVIVVGHAAGDQTFGAERSLLDVLAGVDRRQFDLTCVLPGRNAAYLDAISRYTTDIAIFPYTWWSKRRLAEPDTVDRFAALIQERQPDLVHVNTITLMAPLLAARRTRVPSLVHARELAGSDPDLAGELGETPAAVVATILAATDFIIANSDTTHALYFKPGKSFRLYNCVDAGHFDLPNQIEPGRLKVGIISSNQPKKGIAAFADLAAMAARCSAALEFFVFGPHTDEIARLRSGGVGRGLSHNLHVADYVADPLEAIRQVNVVVSLSDVPESFGRTLAEAMAARRPVITYAWGAAHELVRHGREGFLVPPRDLAQALSHLLMLAAAPERVRAMGARGRRRVMKRFSPGNFAVQLNRIYRRILNGAAGGR